jgi:hypothetical protein
LHCHLLLYLSHQQAKKKRVSKKKEHSCYKKDFYHILSIQERHRWFKKKPCCALILLHLLPWQKLLALQNNQAFIIMMGFDCDLFNKILEKFGPIFLSHTPFDESRIIVPFLSMFVVVREKCNRQIVWDCY